ncbi:MAG: CHAT domain-containing tetratricopeptide repeat protein [Saprospiraceae bacterium]|nr:CHAT domain-containing tetratricopeptide repeat protein [Saprospiraceae bacterium]
MCPFVKIRSWPARRLALLCVWMMAVAPASAQSLVDTLATLSDPDSAFALFFSRQDALSAEERDTCFSFLRQHLPATTAANIFAFAQAHAATVPQAEKLTTWHHAVHLIGSRKPPDTLHLTRTLNYLGEELFRAGLRDSAQAQFLRVVSILPPDIVDEELGVAHNNLGAVFNGRNDPGSALPNYLKARDIFRALLGPDHVYIAVINNNIGQVYANLGRLPEQIAVQELSKEIYLKTVGRLNSRTADVYLNLGIAYKNLKDQARSIAHLEEARAIRSELGNAAGVIAARNEIASHMKTFPEQFSAVSIANYERATITTGVNTLDSTHAALRNAYNNFAFTLADQGDYLTALRFLHLALRAAYPGFSDPRRVATPSLAMIGEGTGFDDMRLLENKAYYLYECFIITGNLTFLEASVQTFSTGDSLIDILRARLLHGDSRSRLIDQAYDYYVNATRSAIMLYQKTGLRSALEQTFHFVEKSRNWRMLEQYLNSQMHDQVLDAGILQQMEALRDALPDEHGIRSGQRSDSIQQLISVLAEQLRRRYPEYFRYLYAAPLASLDSVERFCAARDQQWLHYFQVSRAHFGLILCTPDTTVCHLLDDYDEIKQNARNLRQLIEQRTWSFHQEAYTLFQQLVAPVEYALQPGSLLISSGGLLDEIPFDVLIRQPVRQNGESDPPTMLESFSQIYLVRDYSIALVQSGTFGLVSCSDEGTLRSSTFISPDYLREVELAYAHQEVEAGSKQLNGRLYRGAPGQEVMLEALRRSDLIHFAGHSFSHHADLDSIFLLMGNGDDTLYLRTLFATRSATELVVLGSCRSATGVASRDGHVSLAYGFALAGTPNILSSLWNVTDREASGLFAAYYRAVAQGMTTDAALQHAKILHLEAAPLPARHPYYWANWIYRGHPRIFAARQHPWIRIASIFLLVAAMLMVGWPQARPAQ